MVATKDFHRGDFIVEYAGDLISIDEAKEREANYAKDPTKGCYMYYFSFKNKKYWYMLICYVSICVSQKPFEDITHLVQVVIK